MVRFVLVMGMAFMDDAGLMASAYAPAVEDEIALHLTGTLETETDNSGALKFYVVIAKEKYPICVKVMRLKEVVPLINKRVRIVVAPLGAFGIPTLDDEGGRIEEEKGTPKTPN